MLRKPLNEDRDALLQWYHKNKRQLPWRLSRNPYQIWISEVMLQQTTVQAVVPYFERFLAAFPELSSLAKAPLEQVLEMWAGLGYYSRARNLHRAAKELVARGFPQSYQQLLELPGMGPYTSRAISSIAFGEPVGVVDGNVIRTLSRRYGMREKHWAPLGRQSYQDLSDQLANSPQPGDINQALMELGATVCRPSNPTCLICPWSKSCVARSEGQIDQYPLKKPRREQEIWIWKPHIQKRAGKLLFIKNDYAPFLKGEWLLPGKVKRSSKSPRKFQYKHAITHHLIYVLPPSSKNTKIKSSSQSIWLTPSQVKTQIPSSLIRKALESFSAK